MTIFLQIVHLCLVTMFATVLTVPVDNNDYYRQKRQLSFSLGLPSLIVSGGGPSYYGGDRTWARPNPYYNNQNYVPPSGPTGVRPYGDGASFSVAGPSGPTGVRPYNNY